MSDLARVYEAIKSADGEWINLEDVCNELKIERRIVTDYVSSMIGKRKWLYPGIKRKKTKKTKNRAFNVQVHIHNIWYKYEVKNGQ